MALPNNTQELTLDLNLNGEVVAIFQEDGQRRTKILTQPFSFSIPNLSDTHLGDTVAMEITCTIKSIQQSYNTRRML